MQEALTAGMWSALGSTMGKLSGRSAAAGNNEMLWSFYVIFMIILNTLSFRHYLHALDTSPNSVTPTVISSAANFIVSGIIGLILFQETLPFQWWVGTSLMLCGITVIAKHQKKRF